MEETDRLFTCGYCRVKSYLMAKGFFRYQFTSKAPADKELVYFPYWRVKGMVFFCLHSGVQNRFVDISQQAVKSPYFPISVGFRSQALKLRFVTPETQGYFIKPVQPLADVKEIVTRRYAESLPETPLHEAVIGETSSLIYSPYYVDRKVFDAIVNQAVSPVMPDNFSVEDLPGGKPDWGIQFIPTLCPRCGRDLEGERDSLVLHCKNCITVWKPAADGLKAVAAAHIPEEGDDVVYLPFWRIAADINGVKLDNYADLVRLANLPKVVQSYMETQPFYFWVMAFKVRPQTFLTLSKGFTGAQVQDEPVKKMPAGRLVHVNMPLAEAAESLKLILTHFINPREELSRVLPDLQIKPRKATLVYLPFRDGMHELVQEKFNLAIDKNQLRLASNL